MNTSAISYGPLQGFRSAWRTATVRSLKTPVGLAFFMIFVVVSVACLFINAPFLIIYAAIFYAAYLGKRVVKLKNNMWQEFAAANSWSLDTTTSGMSVIPPSLQFGHSPEFSPIIKASFGEVTCDLLSYNCTTGQGRQSQAHYFTVATTSLPKSMPHLVLRARQNEADVENDMANAEELQLEGNFKDAFKLEVEKGQEIDALSVITPDVMQTLLDYNRSEDIELLGTTLYFIIRDDKRDSASMQQLIESVIELGSQLQENARLSGSASASASVPTAVAPEAEPIIAAAKWRLSRLTAKPTKAETYVILGVIISLLLIFGVAFIMAASVKQY